jgi:hypothetical protein
MLRELITPEVFRKALIFTLRSITLLTGAGWQLPGESIGKESICFRGGYLHELCPL